MGSDTGGAFPGQTDSSVTFITEDENGISFIQATIVCTCDIPVTFLDDMVFICEHCDFPCDQANCIDCKVYSLNIAIRIRKQQKK
jgi:hypothetical protein